MVRLAGLAVACVALLPVAGCGGDDGGKVVEGAGYELTVPDGWDDESSAGEEIDVAGLSPNVLLVGEREDGFTTNVNIIRNDSPGLGLDAQVKAEREVLESGDLPGSDSDLPPAEDLSPVERTTLGDKQARSYEFELEQEDRTLALRQLITIHDDAVYAITLTTLPDRFDEELATFESILDSWRWK